MSNTFVDANFNQAFLLTYRSFCSSAEFLKLLIERFNVSPPEGLTNDQMCLWAEKKQKPVRLRVLNVLKLWIEMFVFDDEDLQLMQQIKSFIKTTVNQSIPAATEQLLKHIEKREHSVATHRRPTGPKLVAPSSSGGLFPILPKNWRKLKFLDLDPLELARQLTLIESQIYTMIRPQECLNKAWSQKGTNDAPNIKEMIKKTNQITGWVAETILMEGDVKKRSLVMKHFISVAEVC